MKEVRSLAILCILVLALSACESFEKFTPNQSPTGQAPELITTQVSSTAGAAQTVGSENPCIGAPAPRQWQHIVVLV